MVNVFVFLTIPAILLGAFGDNGIFKKYPIDERIIGGHDADIKDYPYMLSLILFGYHTCGAVLIAENWALTAAHCIYTWESENFTVRANSSVRHDGVIIQVIRMIEHQNYTYSTDDFDIALLELSPPANCIYCKPIPLGTTVPIPGSNATITGWGRTSLHGDDSYVLQVAQVPTVDHEVCEKAYAEYVKVTENMICAGYLETGGIDTCFGDSGGPLVVDGVLVGLTSMGLSCARPGFPKIYTFVPKFLDWIREITGLPL